MHAFIWKFKQEISITNFTDPGPRRQEGGKRRPALDVRLAAAVFTFVCDSVWAIANWKLQGHFLSPPINYLSCSKTVKD
jgi:hypothetical protein